MSNHLHSALDFLRASRRQEIASLRQLLNSGKLTMRVSQLIHELQRERGASALWLCSAGELFRDELSQCGRQVEQSQQCVMALLPGTDQDWPASSRLLNAIAIALQALDEQALLRQQVQQLQLTQAELIAGFNHVIRQLLHLVFEMVDTASEPAVSRALIALFSFMQGKELAGQERATGVAGFTCGNFSPTLSQQLAALIDAQEHCFSHFLPFADAESQQQWQSLAQHDADVERLRRIACSASPAQQGSALALSWYQALSRRMDGLKTVEDQLVHALMQRCRQNIAEAEARSDVGPEDLRQQMKLQADELSWGVFFTGDVQRANPSVQLQADGVTPQLGRSLLTLVHQQSRQLQDQDDELAAMRASIEDRKQIDRAKVLLMQHHNYSEDQAWQTLRKMAMDQNKRMVDIASALLAVASAFTLPAK